MLDRPAQFEFFSKNPIFLKSIGILKKICDIIKTETRIKFFIFSIMHLRGVVKFKIYMCRSSPINSKTIFGLINIIYPIKSLVQFILILLAIKPRLGVI